METLPMVAWDRRRYLFVPHPCRKKARRGPSMGLFRRSRLTGAKVGILFHTSK